jgi:hypothetical protein
MMWVGDLGGLNGWIKEVIWASKIVNSGGLNINNSLGFKE